MISNDQTMPTGNEMFESFVEQVKQVIEHLYDFAYLQQHPLARVYDGKSDLSAKTAGRQLRYELITAIELLKPKLESNFRAPDARVYNMLHLIYVENLTIQEAAGELGLSERQAYRDLKRGQEMIAATLWDQRLPPGEPVPAFSLQSEMEHLKLNFSEVDISAVFQQAHTAVVRLAQQKSVTIEVERLEAALTLATDAALAHQVMVGVLSTAVQHALPGILVASFEAAPGLIGLTLQFQSTSLPTQPDSALIQLAQRVHWTLSYQELPDQRRQIQLGMASGRTQILVIDDNEGWVALLERFLESYDCLIITGKRDLDSLQQIDAHSIKAIILDVMMPEKDGWELLQFLRAQPQTAQLPIIICTVFNDPELAYSLGASAFLTKPCNRETFLETLKRLSIL